jgi:hypothetical protein
MVVAGGGGAVGAGASVVSTGGSAVGGGGATVVFRGATAEAAGVAVASEPLKSPESSTPPNTHTTSASAPTAAIQPHGKAPLAPPAWGEGGGGGAW